MTIFLAILALLTLICLFLLYRNMARKLQINFLHIALAEKNNLARELSTKCDILQNDKIEDAKSIECLATKIANQEKLISEFEVLTKKSQELTKAALFDLGNDLSKQLIEMHKKETEGNRKLSEETIKATGEKFNQEFEKIVGIVGALKGGLEKSQDTVELIKNSLLSPSGAGKLAEITLENILKNSGLKNGLDFEMQYHLAAEDNSRLRPDAVIFLPADNLMIIDAKASKFLIDNVDNEEKLLKSMNLHLKSLTGKDYAQGMKWQAPGKDRAAKVKYANIITLMFLPSEHAIEKIVEADGEFLNKAWQANIFPVGPAGLMNMLSFAKFQIAEHLMIHNNVEIINEVKKLLASISSLVEYSERFGTSLAGAVRNYDKFAASFNRNFLSKAKNIASLGIESHVSKQQNHLPRYHLIANKAEMIEITKDDVPQLTVEPEVD